MNVRHYARVLIIDDEPDLREVLGQILSIHFTEIVTVASYDEAVKSMEQKDFDVIISDFKLNGKTGLDIRKWQSEQQPDCEFILLTGYASDPQILEHLKTDHFTVLQKPAHPNELILPLKRKFPKKEEAA